MLNEEEINYINFHYAKVDHDRWKEMWSVVGIEIMRSPSNPDYDFEICSHLQGRFPKGFFFPGGWHSKCTCVAVPILVSDKINNEMSEYKLGIRKKAPFVRYYKAIPKNVLSYAKRNMAQCSTQYWYRVNENYFHPQ